MWREILDYYRIVIIVAFDFRCSEDFEVQFSQLVFFILLTFDFPTQQESILFKNQTKNHLRYIFISV